MNATLGNPDKLGHTVLIVDDEPANLGVVSDHLESAGIEVLIARDGEDGIEKARFVRPDLILLDVLMPGIDGFETCRRLKATETTKDIPVIFMTALVETEHKVKGFQLGAVDYITKPFQHEEVLARVTTHLHIRNLTQSLQEQNVQLQTALERNAELYSLAQQELTERVRAEEALQKAHDELELRVQERTAELALANQGLQAEVAERVRAEEALRESEERFRDLFENATDLIQSVTPDGQFLFVNRAWRETLGYSKEQVAGLTLFDIIHPDSQAHCKICSSVYCLENRLIELKPPLLPGTARKS
jgi:DNA-binding response OmpR family regulator